MRTNVLVTLILILVISSLAKSQPYQSIFSTGQGLNIWTFRWGNMSGTTNDTVFIEKDTIVNGLLYKKVITKATYILPSIYPGGLLREDRNTGYVWYKDIIQGNGADTSERVAFRFDLNVGDTFDISNSMVGTGGYPMDWNIVDSVKTINGLKHIYFRGKHLEDEPITIIEGVGSNVGIIWKYSVSTIMMGQYLLCSYVDGQKTGYHNRKYNGACSITTGNIQSLDSNDYIISLYPQPAKDKLFIKAENGINITGYAIYNIQGQLILSQQENAVTEVDLSHIPNGTYYIKMATDNDRYTSKVFIKQ